MFNHDSSSILKELFVFTLSSTLHSKQYCEDFAKSSSYHLTFIFDNEKKCSYVLNFPPR